MKHALILAATALVAAAATADGDATAGQKLFETCRGCHSVPGYTNAYSRPPTGSVQPQTSLSSP